MSTLPADVLVIHYPELATNAEQRLHTLGLIGRLCRKSPGEYNTLSLALQAEDWQQLYLWVEKKGAPFFLCSNRNIYIEKRCEKHVLIGTFQIMEDLDLIESRGEREEHTPTFEDIWSAACQFVRAETKKEAPVHE